MVATNDITGDKIQSKVGDNVAYGDSWERTFGNKTKVSTSKPADSWVLGEPATEVKLESTNYCCGGCH